MGVGPLAVYLLSALSPLVTTALGLSRAQFGLLATVGFAAAAVASAVVGRAVDLLSPRVVMVVLFVGAGLALLMEAVAQSYAWLLAAVILSGSVQALSNPVTNQLVAVRAPIGGRGLLMGVKQSGVQMSQLLAGLALPAVAAAIGWRGAAGLSALVAFLGLALVTRNVPTRTIAHDHSNLRVVALPNAVWWLAAYAFVSGAAVQATNNYLPLFGYERVGMSATASGMTAAVVGGVGLASRIIWGRVAERLLHPPQALTLLAASSALSGVLLLSSSVTGVAGLMWVGAVIFGASGVAANVVVMLALLRDSPSHVVGTASGVLAVGQYVGFAAGPVSFGLMVDDVSDYTTAWAVVVAVFVVAAVLALLWGVKGRHVRDAECP